MQPEKPPAIQPPIHQLLRAEVWMAAALEATGTFDDFLITHEGSFRRTYRNDIEALSEVKGSGPGRYQLALSRDGMYDRLPEGLFHQPKKAEAGSGSNAMVAEYRRYREEEKNARKFFQPLETEFFRYALAMEQEERAVVYGQLYGAVSDEYTAFWGLPAAGEYATAFYTIARLMPWAFRIKGSAAMARNALAVILQKKVTLEERIVDIAVSADFSMRLGSQALGVDTVSGSSFEEPVAVWCFTLHDISHAEAAGLYQKSPLRAVLDEFEERFCPVETEIQYEYALSQNNTAERQEGQKVSLPQTNQRQEEILEDSAGWVLGYNLYI